MTSTQHTKIENERYLRETLIRDLVETSPEAMPVLSQHGIDLCCGGGLTIPAAAEAHGYDADELIQRVRDAIEVERSE